MSYNFIDSFDVKKNETEDDCQEMSNKKLSSNKSISDDQQMRVRFSSCHEIIFSRACHVIYNHSRFFPNEFYNCAVCLGHTFRGFFRFGL